MDSKLENVVLFWSKRFIDHLGVISIIISSHQLKKDETIVKVQNMWKIQNKTKILGKLISKTRQIKLNVQQNLSQKECWYDLISHMLEELQEFENYVNNDNNQHNYYSIQFWTKEHKESSEFLLCQIPVMLKSQHPENIKDFIQKTTKLIQKWNYVVSKEKFLKYSRIQIHSSKKLLRVIIPTLALSDDNKLLLSQLVTHEIKECIWAHKQIINS